MSSLSRLLAALVTLSLLGAACATTEATSASSTVEELPAEETAPAQPPAAQMQTLAPEEGFTVLFPGQVEPQRNSVDIKGGKVTTASWVTEVEGIRYSVSTTDYPEKVIAAYKPQNFLNEIKNGIVNQIKGTVSTEQELALQDYPGKAFTISSAAGEVKSRVYLVGPRLYTLLVVYNPSIGAPRAEEFLGSLALINPPPAITPTSAATGDGGTTMPGDGGTTMPGDGGTTMPGDAGTAMPADGGTRRPTDGGAR
jgi:hypothetical protein